MLPEDAAANEDAGYAMVVYRNFLESEEWMAYRHILSGDFSLIENMNDRSRLSSIYESSQNWDVGRSEWVYVMLCWTAMVMASGNYS